MTGIGSLNREIDLNPNNGLDHNIYHTEILSETHPAAPPGSHDVTHVLYL